MLSEITFCVMGFNTSPISLTLPTSGVHSKGLVVNKLEKPDGITMYVIRIQRYIALQVNGICLVMRFVKTMIASGIFYEYVLKICSILTSTIVQITFRWAFHSSIYSSYIRLCLF